MSSGAAGSAPLVRRGFVEIAEGQVHYRTAGNPRSGQPPLVLLHASPGSAKGLEPLIRAMATHRHVIAPDTLGNGDSCAPADDRAPLDYFAGAHLRVLDALRIERFDVCGAHTGANVACEMAIQRPDRVRGLIIDGIGLYNEQERVELQAHYVPQVRVDLDGSQVQLLWHFVRDAFLFWPWYAKDAVHRRPGGLPGAQELHEKFVEVLKAAGTFQTSYRAALAYPKEQRLPLLRVPTLVTCATSDMLYAYFDRVCALMPQAQSAATRGLGTDDALAETAKLFERFLNDLG